MGSRGSWSRTAEEEQIITNSGGGGGGGVRNDIKIPAAPFQAPIGNKYSVERTLNKTESMISKHTYETGVIIDKQGFVVAAYKGDSGSVAFGRETYKVKGNIVTHNHPSNSAAFSSADILSTGATGGIGIRATTKSNGTAVLRQRRQSAEWEKMGNAYKRFLSGGRTVKQAQNWLKEKAPKYGLEFSIEK